MLSQRIDAKGTSTAQSRQAQKPAQNFPRDELGCPESVQLKKRARWAGVSTSTHSENWLHLRHSHRQVRSFCLLVKAISFWSGQQFPMIPRTSPALSPLKSEFYM